MKIVALGGMSLFPDDIAQLEKHGQVRIYDDTPFDETEIIRRIGDADIVINELSFLSSNVIFSCPNIKLITLATTGYNSVDLSAAALKGVMVSYTPGYATQSVAEHTIGLMLATSRKLKQSSDDLVSGLYSPCNYQGIELHGKILGIIGFGRIGRLVAHIAEHGFGMQVFSYDRSSTKDDFMYILKESDVISLHLPLTPSTKHIINQQALYHMKQDAILINTARGDLIDEDALLQVLDNAQLFAAGLDVLSGEPMDVNSKLITHDRVLVTPHIAYNSREAIEKRSRVVTENIKTFLCGEPQNLVYVCK